MRISFNKIGEPQTRRQANIAKRINLIALTLLFLLLGLIFYAFWELRESKKELERQGIELEEQARRLELMASELAWFREMERMVTVDQKNALEEVREAVKSGDLEGLGELLGSTKIPAQYGERDRKPDVIVFNGLGNQKYEKQLKTETESAGFPIMIHSKDGDDYSWLKRSPTILFFSDDYKKDAIALKAIYDRITGFDFKVEAGNVNLNVGKGPSHRIEVHLGKPA